MRAARCAPATWSPAKKCTPRAAARTCSGRCSNGIRLMAAGKTTTSMKRWIFALPVRDAKAIVPSTSTWRPTRPNFLRTIMKAGCGLALHTRWDYLSMGAGCVTDAWTGELHYAYATLQLFRKARRWNCAAARCPAFCAADVQSLVPATPAAAPQRNAPCAFVAGYLYQSFRSGHRARG